MSKTTVEIIPSDNLFSELGKNNYDYKDLLSELIDNSIAARVQNELLEVNIEIYVDNSTPERFVIRDNASGIAPDELGTALSPGAVQTKNSLNEHGMGMKQAIAALGELHYLQTKTAKETKARQIKDLKFGPYYLIPKPTDPRLLTWVTKAVAEQAIRQGVASLTIGSRETSL